MWRLQASKCVPRQAVTSLLFHTAVLTGFAHRESASDSYRAVLNQRRLRRAGLGLSSLVLLAGAAQARHRTFHRTVPKEPPQCVVHSRSHSALQGWQYDEVRPQLQRALSLTTATALSVAALGVALRQAGLNLELHSGRLYIQWGSPVSGPALEPGSVEVSYRGLQLSPINAAVTTPDQQP